MYSLNGVGKQYGVVSALRNVTCQIPLHGLVAIMGPSGSGKSTLLRMLSFVEVPDAGFINLQLDGRQFSSTAQLRPWPMVTCVFQKQFLWPHLTLRDNIALPLRAGGRAREVVEGKIKYVTDLFGMYSFIGRFPNEVSGGQAQRAALARALALDPQVILLDEAHVALDIEQQKALNDHLIMLREVRVAVIIVTHSIQFAKRYADIVVIVQDGAVTDVGGKELFLTSSYLQRTSEL
jgi:ABC-type polar amino acid transport system ATPase subunit